MKMRRFDATTLLKKIPSFHEVEKPVEEIFVMAKLIGSIFELLEIFQKCSRTPK